MKMGGVPYARSPGDNLKMIFSGFAPIVRPIFLCLWCMTAPISSTLQPTEPPSSNVHLRKSLAWYNATDLSSIALL